MSQIFKLKRSAVAGKVPSTSSLQLGEIALNTTDGKGYFKRSSDDSIQSIVTTNSLTTGSINVSGSFLLTGSQYISDGSLDVGGSITLTNNMGVGGDLSVTGSTFINGNMTAVSGTFDYISASGDFVVDDITSDTGYFGYLDVSGDISVTNTASFGYYSGQSSIVTLGTVTSGDVKAILPSGIVSASAQLEPVFLKIVGDGVVSSSVQIDHDQTTNYVAGEHYLQSQIVEVGAVNSGSITSGFGNIDIGSSTFYTTGAVTLGATTIVGNAEVTGSLVSSLGYANHFEPISTAAYDLGSVRQWRSLNLSSNIYIGGSSLVDSAKNITAAVVSATIVSASGDLVTNGDILLSTNNNGLIGRATGNGQIDLIKINSSNIVEVGSISLPTKINGSGIIFNGSQIISGSVTISGSLIVLGETIEAQVTELSIEDKIITVASGSVNGAASDGAGIEVERGSDTNVSMSWDNTSAHFHWNTHLGLQNNKQLRWKNAAGIYGSVLEVDSGDNVAIGNSGLDEIRFHNAAGNNVMVLNESGYLGIGTTSPTSSLHVYTSTSSDVFPLTLQNAVTTAVGAGVGLKFAQGTTGRAGYILSDRESNYSGVTSNADSALVFATAVDNVDVERLRITSAGNVGIGGTPSYRLDAYNGTTSGILSRFYYLSGSTNSGGGFAADSYGAGRAMLWLDPNGANFANSDYFYIEKYAGGGNTVFNDQQVGSSMEFKLNGTTRLFISASGNVGIGTSSPATKFEISDPQVASIRLNDTGGSFNSKLTTLQQNGDIFQIRAYNDSGTSKHLFVGGYNNTGDVSLSDSRMFISASGNVGIGTTTPGHALTVQKSEVAGTPVMWVHNSNNVVGADTLVISSVSENEAEPFVIRTNTTTVNGGDVDFIVRLVSNSPRVGIGTATPSASLHIVDSETLTKDMLFIKGGGSSGNYNSINVQANNGNELFKINAFSYHTTLPHSSTRLGIGTSSPDYKLHISSSGGDGLKIQSHASDARLAFVPDTSQASNIIFYQDDGSTQDGRINAPEGSQTVIVEAGTTQVYKATSTLTQITGSVDISTLLSAPFITVTNELRLATDGTIDDPSLTFTGDENTGLYYVGTDSFATTAGGIRIQEWNTAGTSITGSLSVIGNTDVVGTVTGTAQMGVTTTSAEAILYAAGGTGYNGVLFLSAAGSGKDAKIIAGNGRDLIFGRSASTTATATITDERFRLTSTGAVVTGTLGVTGTLAATGDIRFGTNTLAADLTYNDLVVEAGANAGISILATVAAGDAGIMLGGPSNTTGAMFRYNQAGTNAVLATRIAGHSLILRGDANVTNLTLSGGSGNELATFARDVTITGALSKGSGTFKINHPNPKKDGFLYHSFVESPTAGDNIYRYQIETVDNYAEIELPEYYQYLNENDQVWISPVEHFGNAYGKVTNDQTKLEIHSNQDGLYNVLLIGTRKDEVAVNNWKGIYGNE